MIFELINMFDWKKKHEILKELKENGVYLNERTFRKTVENHNKLFCEHKVDYYIVHSAKGYKLTQDREEIVNTAIDFRKRAINQFNKARDVIKAMNENDNYNFEIKDGYLVCPE